MKKSYQDILYEIIGPEQALAAYYVAGSDEEYYCFMPDNKYDFQASKMLCIKDTLQRFLDDGYDFISDDPVELSEIIFKITGIRNTKVLPNPYYNANETPVDGGYVLDSPVLLFHRLPLTAFGFQKKIFKRFQLLWMIDHGISLKEAFCEFRDATDPANGFDSGTSSERAFDEWEANSGFFGSLYPCFDEFVGAEYQMKDDRYFLNDQEESIWYMDNANKEG